MGKEATKKQLYEIASLQQGYFTARQAKEAGYSDSRFSYHVEKGHWIREGRGIYRLTQYPVGARSDLVYWSLWSCNRSGEVQGTFSHETALAIHDLSDTMPALYHMTVPQSFRRTNLPIQSVQLHFYNLTPEDYWEYEGYRVTTPVRTVSDILTEERVSEEIAMQAVFDGVDNGIISKEELIKRISSSISPRAQRLLSSLKGR